MCNECPACGTKGTMIWVSTDKKLSKKYPEDSDMQYGCVCSQCGDECCMCV